jgi:hypothetical protein
MMDTPEFRLGHLTERDPALIRYHCHLNPCAIELCDRLRRVRQEREVLPSCDVSAFLRFAVYDPISIKENQLNICEHIAHQLKSSQLTGDHRARHATSVGRSFWACALVWDIAFA